ncbi:MAG: nitroreductase [Bacteroidetes bacterium]|nr:nitroreductase [Bacteroidota bacterium]
MKIDEYIQHRRSHFIKEFSGKTVPDSVLDKMLENARWAPSHKLTLPWRFRVFSGDEKNKLCEQFEKYYIEKTPSEKFDQIKLDKIRTYKSKISHIISIGMKPSGKVPEWEELAATAMAVQNMYLTLGDEPHAAGYWTSGNGAGSEWMRAYTGLEEGDKQMGFFFLGWVDQKRVEAVR